MGPDGDGYFERAGMSGVQRLAEPPPDRRLAHAAAFGLLLRAPGKSAAHTLSAGQRRSFRKGLTVLGLAGLAAPELWTGGLGLLGAGVFAAVLAFRTALYVLGALSRPKATSPETEPDDWPVYTLLIALKDEAETAAQMAAAIRALDYPASRLDVELLIEAGDEATAYALRRLRWPDRTELLMVPPGLPRTKPRALNYGLARARGAFVVVYDAEDRPRADQLKAAVRAFHAALALGGVARAGFRGFGTARGAGVPDAGRSVLRSRDDDGAGRAGEEGLAATLPLYWPLQSVAMARALYDLAKCSHFWAKTPHRA
jgi:hypothetical protein